MPANGAADHEADRGQPAADADGEADRVRREVAPDGEGDGDEDAREETRDPALERVASTALRSLLKMPTMVFCGVVRLTVALAMRPAVAWGVPNRRGIAAGRGPARRPNRRPR